MICNICKEDKPKDEFYSSSGRKCKKCSNKHSAEYRLKNIDRKRKYDKERDCLPHRLEHTRKKCKRQNRIHRRERNCNLILHRALKTGKVIKKEECEISKCTNKPIGHHFDYNRPLDVIWLCSQHHVQYHLGVYASAMKIKEEVNRLVIMARLCIYFKEKEKNG